MADEDHEPDGDRDDAEALHDDVAEHEGAAQGLRQRDRDRRGAPDRVDRLLGDDQAAHGDEDLLQVAAIDRADDHPLEDRTDNARHRHGAQDAEQQQARG